MINRRAFFFGAGAALAAPAIVRPTSLMKLFVPRPKLLCEATLLEAIQRMAAVPEVEFMLNRPEIYRAYAGLLPGLNALFSEAYDHA